MSSDETLPGTSPAQADRAETVGAQLPQGGEVVLGRYRIERELGRGGQAFVFEARDLELDRLVALKVLAPTLGGGEDWRGLLEEARLQAAVEAPGVARLLDAIRDGERRYLVMELVRGPGLKEVVAELRDRSLAEQTRPRGGAWLAQAAGLDRGSSEFESLARLSWDLAVAGLGICLARSVGTLHERGLIHRDLKPSNITLDPTGSPVVLDFGLARWLDAPENEQVAGTPGYMAPEQLVPRGACLDERTDIYQLGLILHELLTLERAYPKDSLSPSSSYIMLASVGRVRDVREVDPRANPGLAAIVGRALAPDPGQRYASMEDLAQDLERVAAGRPPLEAPTPLGFRTRCATRKLVRGRLVIALLAAAVLIPGVWSVRAAFLQDVTTVEGWRFSPRIGAQFDVVSGSPIQVGDDLGIRVTTSSPTVVYVLSVFGGEDAEQRLVSPMHPLPLVEGVPQPRQDTRWGMALAPGTHELICTRIEEPNSREGLLVFAAGERLSILEQWLESLQDRRAAMPFGIEQALAFALLDDIRDPSGARGGSVLAAGRQHSEEQLARERERYAGLNASTAAGLQEWDLGEDLIRFELLCEVIAE